MTRLIERWFPCAEVSDNSGSGWGSGNTERGLFTWFAARPSAQAKAAVICSLLLWPGDPEAQECLRRLVREAMTGRYAKWKELREEILRANADGATVLDPFSGRGMIPLEAARLGIPAYAIDYSPVAVLAGELLTDYPFRDWSGEPELNLGPGRRTTLDLGPERLLRDVETVLNEIGRRHEAAMEEFYPVRNGVRPWGYLWAVTIPCQECGRRFPLIGSYELRKRSVRAGKGRARESEDSGQSYYLDADAATGTFRAVVHDGPPKRVPTLSHAVAQGGKKVKGRAATCLFCGHVHPLPVHQRLASEGFGRDTLLLVGELDPNVGKVFREPTEAEHCAADAAAKALTAEKPFGPLLPAIPSEEIPLNNGATIRPQLYGARTYGDLMCARQTLSFVRLARIIGDLGLELTQRCGVSTQYARALTGYAAANMVRKLRRSTRGSALEVMATGGAKVGDLFGNESTIGYHYDFFEAGIGDGPGTWNSMIEGSISTLRSLLSDIRGTPVRVVHGSAAEEPWRDASMTVVVTDPPYDSMVYYTDSSDLLYVWLKRALHTTRPEISVTSDPRGIQEKTDEIIVKEHGKSPSEHRDRTHYDTRIEKAFSEMRRVVRDDGVVTLVFGHGEPEVWQRLLSAIDSAGLVMTGSWPANTEAGSHQGKANIETTLTMCCRPAKPDRPEGRRAAVEAEIRTEIRRRYVDWERWGLAPTDMLMAAAGPAMEIVGRYRRVLDARGESVDISTFLPLARAVVQEAMAVKVDDLPLETFDGRTRFALWWVRLYGRQVVAKSELRWQALAASIDLAEVRDLIAETDERGRPLKGCRFAFSASRKRQEEVSPESPVVDIALALASAADQGLEAASEVLLAAGRNPDDAYLWAAISFLADRLPDSDPDAIAWTRILRNRAALGSVAKTVVKARETDQARKKAEDAQLRLIH